MARRNHGEGTKARRRHGRAPAALETVFGAGDVRRVAFYCRVSTEEQADRGTIQNQLHKLRQFAQVKEDEWRVVGEYIDDGCSGALWLENRPNGARLLSDARRGLLDVVVVYKLDRLARTLDALLDAHDALAELNVSIFSTQETFDTGTPAGKLVFQILGSIAEFERATILERTSIGRDRVAGQGRWIGGPVPFGYELDPDGKLAPSTRIVYAPQGASPVNEADMVRSIFARIADGSTLGAECHRLNALGIPTDRHYASGKARQKRKAVVWLPTVLRRIIHSPVYVGRSAYRASNGEVIERECPALVSHETWEQAHAQLARNRSHTDKDTKERYLLRGLIRCAECGGIYSGVTQRNRSGSTQQFYRCKNQLAVIRGDGKPRCKARSLPLSVVENAVWAFCLDVARYPDKHLAELVARVQSQLREVVGAADDDNGEADELRRALLENEAERERAMLLFRKRLATWEETERALGEINRAKESLRTRLDELEAQRALVVLDTERLTSVAAGLAAWAETVEEADRTGDWHTKRAWVELLVRTIVATTVVQEGRKEAHLEVKVVAGPQPPQPKATAVSVLQRS